jgi:uncharacterized protein (DUF2147 family)
LIKPDVVGGRVDDRLVLDVSPLGPSGFKGQAWDPQRRMVFSFRLDVGDLTVATQGYAPDGMLCEDMGWTRLDGPE